MAQIEFHEGDEIILVDFGPVYGVRGVSRGAEELLAESIAKSQKAINHAMGTISALAKKTMATIKAIPITERPSTIEVSFGLKLDAEAGAVVAKAGTEASINVTMTWTHTDKES